MMDPVLSALLAATGVFVVALIFHRSVLRKLDSDLHKQLELTNAAERQTHLKELDFLSERNKLILDHATEISSARAAAFEEGKKQGRSEQELECKIQLADQYNRFSIQIEEEKNAAIAEARDKQRVEYELQQKLFSVKISPYVQIVVDKGIVYDKHEAKVGYQYQLLINGIPAFQPHVIVERHENIKQVDQAVKDSLLKMAEGLAGAAVNTYLGGSAQFAKLAPAVIDTVKK